MNWQQASPTGTKSGRLRSMRFNPFRTLLTPLLLIMAAGIIIASLVTYQAHRKILKESLLRLTDERAHSSQLIIQNHLHDNFAALLREARNLLAHHEIRQEMHRILESSSQPDSGQKLQQILDDSKADSGLTNVYIYNEQGQLIYTHEHLPGLAAARVEITEDSKRQETAELIRNDRTWIFRVTVPIQKSGENAGVLVLSIELNRVLDNLARENQMNLVLADANGIQAQNAAPAALTRVDTATVAQILTDGSMQTQIDLENNSLNHYMPVQLGGHNFVLINELELQSVTELLLQKKYEIQQLTLLLLFGLLPASALVIHLLLKPLDRLQKRADGMALQLSGSSLKRHRGHEIGRMVAAFDGMERALRTQEDARQKAEAKLQQEHATLETRVKERTSDLERTNALLQREISERTCAQQKAEELQGFLASLIDSMPSSLIGVNHHCRINQWNLEAQKFCGLSFDQVRDRDLYDCLPPLRTISDRIEQTLDKGLPNKVRRLRWPSAKDEKLVDIVIYPHSGNQSAGAVIRVDDVTERAHIEELMMQTEKMMSIGGLAAGMAHEINNPLASIIQSVQVIRQRLSPELEKNHQVAGTLRIRLEDMNGYLKERQISKMLNSIQESGQRAGEIVSNMLSFTRRTDSVKSSQNIAELLDRAVDLACKDYDLKKKYDFHRIKIKRNYAEIPPKIICNSSQLQQVFFNLMQNAAQAMASWCEMGNSPQIELTLQPQGHMLLIEVADNGPGIDTETQKRIFEPFFTTKDVGFGTGLGLSVSYFIITENHGGQIEIESAVGKGAKFRVFLPLQNTVNGDSNEGLKPEHLANHRRSLL